MPSSKNYKRNYAQEIKTAEARGERGSPDSKNSKRAQLRYHALKLGLVRKGQDLDHRVPLSKGGANTLSNVRPMEPSKNRSFPRNKDGSMK